MKFVGLLGACLALGACAQEASRAASEQGFYPVHVGASSQFLSSGVAVSLADAMAWGLEAPMVRGGQSLRAGAGTFAMQRLRYDDYDMVLVEAAATAGALSVGRDVAGPVERQTGCRMAAFDKASQEALVGRRVIPLEC